MIRLNQILKEISEGKQVGTLYHFTSYKKLGKIVESNFVLTAKFHEYVSFTRNKYMKSDTISQNVRITVDGDKLSNKYKFEPHADTRSGYGRKSTDEAEERVSLERYPNGVDISKAIKAIEIKNPEADYDADPYDEDTFEPPSLLEYEKLIKYLKANNIPFQIVDKFK